VVNLKRGQQLLRQTRAARPHRTPAGWLALAVAFAVSAMSQGMPLPEDTVLAWLNAALARLRPAASSVPAAPSVPAGQPCRRD
jgi:hypothetical protein